MHQDIVVYFVDEDRIEEALQAGATHAGGIDLVTKVIIHATYIKTQCVWSSGQVLDGDIQPTKVFSTSSLLPVITPKLGRFLGPKNLMPSVKKGTVSDDISTIIKATKGTFGWKGDKLGTIRAAIGRVVYFSSFDGNNWQCSVHEAKLRARRCHGQYQGVHEICSRELQRSRWGAHSEKVKEDE
jgi:ribosomal protein L1